MTTRGSTGCTQSSSSSTVLPIQYLGDDIFLNLSFKDDSFNKIDLTGSTLTLTVKEQKTDVVAVYTEVQTDIDMLDPVNGIVQFHIPAATTETFVERSYVYDIFWDTVEGSHTTIIVGSIPVKAPVHTD